MKTKTGKCEYCSPESTPELCKLSTAKTVIDGEEHSSCCSKCAGDSTEGYPKKDAGKQVKE
jgi:hypothetical protein